jgi:cell division protein FtsW
MGFFGRSASKNSRLVRPTRGSTGQSFSTASAVSRKHRPDYVLILLCLALLGMGLIVVYSISPGLAASNNVSENYYVTKQLIAIGLGLVTFIIFGMLPLKVLKASSWGLVAAAGVSVILVQLFGETINGASRWIQMGGLSFQVAELIKLALIIWLAIFLVERVRKGEIASDSKTLKPILIVVALIGLFVAKLESDLGSTGVMVAIIGLMAFTVGLPLKKIAMIVGVIAIGTVLAISTSSYRRDRVSTFLNPTSDCQAAGYQSCQALIAVGSGGMFGLGLGKSVQAFGYLPEAANDSIFAVLAEKFGFVGTSLVLGIYVALFARMRRIILRTSDLFSRLLVVGVLAWISTQAIINIGAMVGLLPLKGITLPFISYGGTSLIFAMAAIGIVFHISRYTSFAPIRNSTVSEEETGHDDYARRRGQRRTYHSTAGNR